MNDPLEFAQPARSSDTEQLRVQTLRSLQLLDTSAEQEYDDLVQLAAAICGTPIAFLSLVDTERQWFKAATGIDFRETPRKGSFCHHAIQQPNLFVVPDAHADERFASSFLVTGNPHVRFYAGMPLQAPNGHTVGALCVYDTVPRELTVQQSDALRVLSTQIQTHIELRARQVELEDALKRLEQANILLQDLSTTDSLTGLFNRRCFQEKLDLEFTRARRNQRDLALVMIDIDNFKRCNDTYGHTAGDAVLRQVGEILHASIRSIDIAARFGGEEFALILPEATIDTATQLCQRLRRNLAARTWIGDPVTVSIGISMLTPESPTSEHLVIAADAALYQAKAAGKDTFRVLALPLPPPSLPLMQQAS